MHKNKFHAVKYFGVAVICAGLCVARAQGQETDKKAAPKKSSAATAKMAEPFIGTPDKIKWVQYSPGVEFGPVHGNCDQAGAPCVFQLRFADGGKFPPHWHPVDEHVTVLSGTFMAGMGDSYDESKMVTLRRALT